MDLQNLRNLVEEKLLWGEKLLQSLTEYNNLEGVQKLEKKIKQELKFLRKIHRDKSIKAEHLQCSNLTHYTALVDTLKARSKECMAVSKVFYIEDRKLTVDIVCDNGLTWVKVVARNPKSLEQISLGDASYGVRSILDQAEEFIECAQNYPCLFQTPKVVFVFTNNISDVLVSKLEEIGIVVEQNEKEKKMNTVDVSCCSDLSTKDVSLIKKINLDVSAMLAYVSSVTNGSCKLYEFNVPVLKQQAEWECERPQKPILTDFFREKRLYCCQTAYDSFLSIVNTVGGEQEKIRAKDFLEQIIVLPDDATAADTIEGDVQSNIFGKIQLPSDKKLLVGGKIRERSLIIFTFGDRIQAVTVTANDGFVRAAKQQGIEFVVFLHESRALTEQKELNKAVKKIED